MSALSDEWQQCLVNSISHDARLAYSAIAENATEPHVLMRPNISPDGNQWCVLYGANLHEGVAGFGDTPAKAMADFDRNWRTEKAATAERSS